MAPVLDQARHDIMRELINDGKLSAGKIAELVQCSKRTVQSVRSNMRHFGFTKTPHNSAGMRSRITQDIKVALNELLLKDPTLYQKDLILILKERYGFEVTGSTVCRALRSLGQSRTKARQGAGARAKITPPMKSALYKQLIQNPTYHHKDLVHFLKERYGIEVTSATVCRALQKYKSQLADQKDVDQKDTDLGI
jgi:arginine repressor